MGTHTGTTVSSWMDTAQAPPPEPLGGSSTADVCIIGAGIAGLTTAYLLAREGRSVLVLDDGPVGSGETERTTAHISNALDDRYTWLERKHGEAGIKLAAESHTAAISEIERICRNEGIECDFMRLPGYLFVPPGVSGAELEDELEAARRAGLKVERISNPPYRLYDTDPVLEFPGQAQFHAVKYLTGLSLRIEQLGGKLAGNTHVTNVTGGDSANVETANGAKVSCAAVVVAANTPFNDRVTMHTKQAPYRTYAIAAPVPAGAVPTALYWDTAQSAEEARKGHNASYHYVRLQPLPGGREELLIVGGEDHKTGQANDMEHRWAALHQWTRERFPMAGAPKYRWSGQVLEPIDGMAFIGRNPGDAPNVYIATGDSGHGITHGTIAGILIRDLILGRENPWTALYDPARKGLGAVGQFTKENLNVAAQYAELLTGGEISSAADLRPNSGGVMRSGTKKIAVYRDEQGGVHQFSAICPHLGCVVHWNPGEKSWDCPCHGSRYSAMGEVLNGPSPVGLKPVED